MSYPMFLPFWINADAGDGGSIPSGSGIDGLAGGGIGEDIWFDVSLTNSMQHVDRIVTPHGDWKMVSGEEALRQSLRRRIITSPGEWALIPEYGVGAREFVKASLTKSNRDELTNRIHAQFLRDHRVTKVTQVVIDQNIPEMLAIRVEVATKLRPADAVPLSVHVEVR